MCFNNIINKNKVKLIMSIIKSKYSKGINDVINYIQSNIDEKLSLKELAEIAKFSPYHFHRIFSANVGESLSSYIKRIKLDNSALKLKYTNENISDIAMSCGYESTSAYAKAFKQEFCLTASEFRLKFDDNNDEYMKQLKKISEDSYQEIKDIQDIKRLFTQSYGPYRKVFDEAWTELLTFANSKNLINENTKYIAICLDDPDITAQAKLRYQACITYDGNDINEDNFAVKTIPGGKHAIFRHKGSYETLYKTYDAALLYWMQHNYEKFNFDFDILRDVPCFEVLNADFLNTKPEDLVTDIYIPVE